MNSIKIIALIISLLALICSCNTSDKHDKSKRKAKLYKLFYVINTDSYIAADSTVIIKYVDTSYKAGNIIEFGDVKYRLLN